MSIWEEGFDVLTATDSELSESVVYHASLDVDPVPMSGVFLEDLHPRRMNDLHGDRTVADATLELPLTLNGSPISIAETGKAWFVIRESNWIVESVSRQRASLLVQLYQYRDQSIRRPQKSTR